MHLTAWDRFSMTVTGSRNLVRDRGFERLESIRRVASNTVIRPLPNSVNKN
jgi:hypothetical protein